MIMRRLLATLIAGVVVCASTVALPAQAAAQEPREHKGEINGARYRVEVPKRWNGTLVLYSHGYIPDGFTVGQVQLSNNDETREWLLDHGYALAASEYQNKGVGYLIKEAMRDQLALLDWFNANVGKPRRTVLSGQSLGGSIATLLAERYPNRFDGALNLCAVYDPLNTFNTALDINFAVRTLLAPGEDIDLVNSRDPKAGRAALHDAINRTRETRQGQARLALAAALGNVTGWFHPHEPKPTDPAGWIRRQSDWVQWAKVDGNGTVAFADIAQRAGGNPLSNVGVNYTGQLARSGQRAAVERAYRKAGLDLRADLARLAAAPRIASERDALRHMYRYGVPTGGTRVPIVGLHTTGDAGAPPDQGRWYADQVRRNGHPDRLRQFYVERGGHCSFNAAEELTAFRALLTRIDTGHWPRHTDPRRLNAEANRFDPRFHLVAAYGESKKTMAPAFTRYSPPLTSRPSR
ncbi:putative esterase [Actinomadura pelletieri DSM 43383]|uniref:Putative esterase n=2 Tax=Actinomadura pelletieri TaxID=111805 RepID=A0A495QXY4_9ACTN|nr:putative esterase [Actinomadura pelletieri DSM 43383]